MSNMHFDKWSAELIEMVPKYGKTMEQAAKEAYEAGKAGKEWKFDYVDGVWE